MTGKEKGLSRRQFVKAAGFAGAGAAVMGRKSLAQSAQASPNMQDVPKRTFGKTGEEVSILSLGGNDFRNNQLLLRQAIKMGVTYWDTSEKYAGGGSEKGIGKYLQKYPEDRKKVFLVTKAKRPTDPDGLTKSLEGSLERLKTTYVDLYFLHAVTDVKKQLTPEIKAWAEKTKTEGKIRYFGFSTHENVEECLEVASRLDWIDGIMMTYNYQTMGTDRVKAAVEACAKAGIGLTAMKTQAKTAKMTKEMQSASPGLEENLTERFRKKGFTMEQAKLRLVWESPHIASICSSISNMTFLMQNAAAALGKVALTQKDKDLLARHVARTRNQYCPGCTRHCQSGAEKNIPIGLVMRCLMYARDYGDRDKGKNLFQSLHPEVREAIARGDYVEAEKRCPNGLPIGSLMREAAVELA